VIARRLENLVRPTILVIEFGFVGGPSAGEAIVLAPMPTTSSRIARYEDS
jgi:GTPase involved in cell partitioning and DNA repair